MNYQDNFYFKKESNSFFLRWQKSHNYDGKLRKSKEEIKKILVKKINLKKKKILEIGCFIGDLLFDLKSNYKSKIYGVEPSSLACKFAKKKFKINLENNTFLNSKYFINNSSNYQKFDLIICDDILSWVSRDLILPTLGSIDWILKPNGHLFLRDFSPTYRFAVKNHHWHKEKIFNFKQKNGHKSFFLETGKYEQKFYKKIISNKYQTIKSSNRETLIWSDSLLKKINKFNNSIFKI